MMRILCLIGILEATVFGLGLGASFGELSPWVALALTALLAVHINEEFTEKFYKFMIALYNTSKIAPTMMLENRWMYGRDSINRDLLEVKALKKQVEPYSDAFDEAIESLEKALGMSQKGLDAAKEKVSDTFDRSVSNIREAFDGRAILDLDLDINVETEDNIEYLSPMNNPMILRDLRIVEKQSRTNSKNIGIIIEILNNISQDIITMNNNMIIQKEHR